MFATFINLVNTPPTLWSRPEAGRFFGLKMQEKSRISVAVIEDDEAMSLSLVEILDTAMDIDVVATFSSGEEALSEIAHCVPEVVLLDLRLPGMSGIECAHRLKEKHPSVHLMILTAFEDDDALFASLAAGANGYLLKRAKPSEVITAIRELKMGGSPMSPGIARKLVGYFQKLPAAVASADLRPEWSLSSRENEVLKMLASGHRDKEIAEELNISFTTVRTYLGRIYDKLQVTSRAEAVARFHKKS